MAQSEEEKKYYDWSVHHEPPTNMTAAAPAPIPGESHRIPVDGTYVRVPGAGPIRDYPLKGWVEEMLAARDSTHGPYKETARLVQHLKSVMHQEKGWQDLNAEQKEALDMCATKIGRILCGDQNHVDSWRDLAGYATLIVDSYK